MTKQETVIVIDPSTVNYPDWWAALTVESVEAVLTVLTGAGLTDVGTSLVMWEKSPGERAERSQSVLLSASY